MIGSLARCEDAPSCCRVCGDRASDGLSYVYRGRTFSRLGSSMYRADMPHDKSSPIYSDSRSIHQTLRSFNRGWC